MGSFVEICDEKSVMLDDIICWMAIIYHTVMEGFCIMDVQLN